MKKLDFEQEEILINSYYKKNEQVKAQVCIDTFLDYLNVNGYLNVKRIKEELL